MALDRFRAHKASPDYTYITLAGILILTGLVMISSSSVVLSVATYNENYAFVIRQAIAIALGVIAGAIISRIDYRLWRHYAMPIFIGALVLALLVFIPGLGKATKGASRWIDFGFFQLQPSELLKISFILFLAAWIEKVGAGVKKIQEGVIPFGILMGFLIFLMMLQRDMGTLLVLLMIGAAMFIVSGARKTHLIIGFIVGVLLIGVLIMREDYRRERLMVFLNPSADTLDSGYHINQSLLAIGSGGVWGKGFGHSVQKYLYLPEPHTDSIFAITVEELGFVRSIMLLIIIGLFSYRGFSIAIRAGDVFSRMVAFGITTWFTSQSLINIAAILGLVPLTGIPLPFISYGGTAVLVGLIAVGMMTNISRHSYGN